MVFAMAGFSHGVGIVEVVRMLFRPVPVDDGVSRHGVSEASDGLPIFGDFSASEDFEEDVGNDFFPLGFVFDAVSDVAVNVS